VFLKNLLKKSHFSLKCANNNVTPLYMKIDTNLLSYRAQIVLTMRNVSHKSCTEMFHTKAVQKCFTQKLYRKSKHTFWVQQRFQKIVRLWDNVETYGRAGQATDGNMAHAHCMQDNYGYWHNV